jgi:hypothetical protein
VAARIAIPKLQIAEVRLFLHVNGADHVRVLGNKLDVLGSLEDLEGKMDIGEARNTRHIALPHAVQLFALIEIRQLLLTGAGR